MVWNVWLVMVDWVTWCCCSAMVLDDDWLMADELLWGSCEIALWYWFNFDLETFFVIFEEDRIKKKFNKNIKSSKKVRVREKREGKKAWMNFYIFCVCFLQRLSLNCKMTNQDDTKYVWSAKKQQWVSSMSFQRQKFLKTIQMFLASKKRTIVTFQNPTILSRKCSKTLQMFQAPLVPKKFPKEWEIEVSMHIQHSWENDFVMCVMIIWWSEKKQARTRRRQ